jgi:hypothetical protein
MVAKVVGVKHVCAMNSGARAHLLRCSNGRHYVVKFKNNPQGVRVLANELIATLAAQLIGLPVASPAVVDVSDELIRDSGLTTCDVHGKQVGCASGLSFGSRFVGRVRRHASNSPLVCTQLSDEHLKTVENLSDFYGMLVFDQWTCNGDGRQVVFSRAGANSCYRATMIDNGFCFDGQNWSFPHSPRRGIFNHRIVYSDAEGPDSIQKWVDRLDREITREMLVQVMLAVPPEWYESDLASLSRLLESLLYRKRILRELLASTIGYLSSSIDETRQIDHNEFQYKHGRSFAY